MADSKTPLLSLAQLKTVTAKCQGKIAEALKAASDAITEVANNKADKDHTHTQVNGHTVEADVPAGAKFTDTNTWRGVVNNLTSTSTSSSLTAAMGKKLQDEKAAKVNVVSLSIPATGWATDSTTACPAYKDITVSGLTANDVVAVVVAPASTAIAHAAGLSTTESRAGVLRLRAQRAPTAAISAYYYIIR